LQAILSRPGMEGFKRIHPAQMRRRACVPVDALQVPDPEPDPPCTSNPNPTPFFTSTPLPTQGQVRIEEQTISGYRLVALKGRMEQQVFVTADGQHAARDVAAWSKLQAAIEEALGEHSGAVLPMDGGAAPSVAEAGPSKPAVALTDEELKQRLLQRYSVERELEADAVLEATVGPRSRDANRSAAAQLELETRREHKAKHEREKEAMAHATSEKNVAAATRKLRSVKGCMDSTTHTGSAGHLDKGSLGTGSYASDREAQKALVRAHAEDAAARKRF